VHGSAEATEHLKMQCVKHVCPQVYAPQIEETIDVTSDLCAYKVLDNNLLLCSCSCFILFEKEKKLGKVTLRLVQEERGLQW
jgi:cleavage and polyadenylation specificity factor subunit 2